MARTKADKLLDKALSAYDKRRWPKVIKYLEEILAMGIEAGAAEVACTLAEAYLETEVPDRALRVLIELDCGEIPWGQVLKGRALLDLGREKEALSAFLGALLAGGKEVFESSPLRYYEYATAGIKPPAGCSSWDEYEPEDDDDDDDDDDDGDGLFGAIELGDSDSVRRLLSEGADCGEVLDGVTPLAAAVREDHPEIVRLLLDHGVRSDAGANPMHLVRSKRVLDMLVAAGLPIDSVALIRAVSRQAEASAVLEMLRLGADPNATDKWGNSVLGLAREGEEDDPGYKDVVAELLARGAGK